jgi:pantothenate synthetase
VLSCADYDTLEELEQVKGKALLSMAVFMGKTRLIDNKEAAVQLPPKWFS